MEQTGQGLSPFRPPSAGRRVGEVAAVAVSLALLVVAAGAAMDYCLASALGQLWPRYLWPQRPAGIVIHHSATPPVKDPAKVLAAIGRSHAERGWGIYFAGRVYHVGYHYLVMPDGRIVAGRPEWMPGAHCRGHNDMIGICLVGNFVPDARGRPQVPTDKQLRACVELVKKLLHRAHLPATKVYLHRDLGHTLCPGPCFPARRFRKMIENEEPQGH